MVNIATRSKISAKFPRYVFQVPKEYQKPTKFIKLAFLGEAMEKMRWINERQWMSYYHRNIIF